jgi:hypothetical protein
MVYVSSCSRQSLTVVTVVMVTTRGGGHHLRDVTHPGERDGRSPRSRLPTAAPAE